MVRGTSICEPRFVGLDSLFSPSHSATSRLLLCGAGVTVPGLMYSRQSMVAVITGTGIMLSLSPRAAPHTLS